jgi:hypothetical protein
MVFFSERPRKTENPFPNPGILSKMPSIDAKSSYEIDLETKRNYQVEFRKRKLDQSINFRG